MGKEYGFRGEATGSEQAGREAFRFPIFDALRALSNQLDDFKPARLCERRRTRQIRPILEGKAPQPKPRLSHSMDIPIKGAVQRRTETQVAFRRNGECDDPTWPSAPAAGRHIVGFVLKNILPQQPVTAAPGAATVAGAI